VFIVHEVAPGGTRWHLARLAGVHGRTLKPAAARCPEIKKLETVDLIMDLITGHPLDGSG
jgi:hypothetical protein